MEKNAFMSAAKKARIALAVMAVCGMSFAGGEHAFAENVTIDQDKNIICGDGATAKKNPNSTEEGTGMIVIGNSAAATGLDSIALGTNAVATGDRTTAIGGDAKADHGGVAIGSLANASGTYDAVAIGYRTKASGRYSTAIGKDAAAEGQDSLAIAYSAKALAKNSVALGYMAKAAVEESIAIGYYSSAEAKSSFALGSNSKVTGVNSVAIGTGSEAKRDNSVSVGAGTQYRQIINVAYGTGKNDAATYGQILRDTWSTIKIDDDGNGSTKLTKNDGTEGPTINVDASSLNKKITKNTNSITAVDNKIGSLSTDGTYIKKVNNVSTNLGALDTQVKANAGAITAVDNKIGTIASGTYVEAGKNVAENLGKLDTQVKANADAIGSLSADGTYIKKANNVSANLGALDTQVKTNTDAIGSLSADGKYIKKANNVSANLVELDNQVNTNTTALTTKANLDLSNINADGETKIKNLAGSKAGEIVDVKLGTITSTHYVSTGNTVNANISALDSQLNQVDNKIGSLSTDGTYIKKANNVSANLSALDNQLKINTEAIAEKADKNLSNITDAGKNVIKDLAGNKAGEIVDTKLGDITSENYVKKTNTVNANISKLDEQVKANADAIKTNADAINTKADKDLSNITDAGKNVIKDLAGSKAGEIVDAKLGDITSENYVKKTDTVNANISKLDEQMKANTDNIGDTSKLTAAGLGANLSDAVVNVNNKVGTADELKALKDAGLGDNLAQATAAVNKKADKNAADIKTVNGRVDELGGRVDTLGGAVSKLDTKVNKVGAGAAALAALHPMDFDPDNKLSFAAGVGSYHGASAVAIGAFYRPSEQVMFSISGNMGNGENMVNAGVSFALDRPSKTPTTKAALVKTVAAQNEQIAALKETVAEQKEIVAEQNEKIARLEAMVEKLAAKQST